MKKRFLSVILLAAVVLTFTACSGQTKTVHCDNCGKEIQVDANSNVTEDWTLYCDECNKELGIEENIIDMINNN